MWFNFLVPWSKL
uniref:Uncharacterized protein n=1 Tax=Leersia perrieri TaxID=77586 RepID=A0A0D9X4D9_9ORYZ